MLIGGPVTSLDKTLSNVLRLQLRAHLARVLMGTGPKQYLRQRKTSTVVRARMLTVATTPPVIAATLISESFCLEWDTHEK